MLSVLGSTLDVKHVRFWRLKVRFRSLKSVPALKGFWPNAQQINSIPLSRYTTVICPDTINAFMQNVTNKCHLQTRYVIYNARLYDNRSSWWLHLLYLSVTGSNWIALRVPGLFPVINCYFKSTSNLSRSCHFRFFSHYVLVFVSTAMRFAP